jgi:hypothetical protein
MATERATGDEGPKKGRVYVLGPDNKPQPRDVILGATDLRNTSVMGGDLKAGEMVIISETYANAGATTLFGAASGGSGGSRPRGPF